MRCGNIKSVAFIPCRRFSKQEKSAALIEKTKKHLAHNYDPLPVVLCRGEGVHVFDVEGNKYLDFLSGYSAVSFGHSHPKIAAAMSAQCKKLTLTSRGFYTKALSEFSEHVTRIFEYDKVLPTNTGVEAGETAVKLARKWGYKVKSIPVNKAKVIFPNNNFWGRTIAAVSSSTDPSSFENYGPFVPGFETVPFNDECALNEKLKDPCVCAFMVEPIQGEAGIILPAPGYLRKVREMCTENNVLMIADEVQCGLGRAGSLICCQQFCVKPDLLLLGKALSGGFMPVSAVLANKPIMDVIEPGTHGTTFGGNPLACKVAQASLDVLIEEKLSENSKKMGRMLRCLLSDLPKSIVTEVRGKGLMNAIVIHKDIKGMDVCLRLMCNGLLTRPTRGQILRLTPPLTITECNMNKAADIIKNTIETFIVTKRDCSAKPKKNPKTVEKKKCKKKRVRPFIKAISEQAGKRHPFIRT